jgi:thiol-disulfide isomerase/thioredoxin
MTFNGTNVIHLEDTDFKNNVLHFQGAPVKGKWLVMVQGTYCGFCTKSKKPFVDLSEKYPNNGVIFATVHIDGTDPEKNLGRRLSDIIKKPISGVPAYLLFENGKFSAMVSGGKGESELIEFMK